MQFLRRIALVSFFEDCESGTSRHELATIMQQPVRSSAATASVAAALNEPKLPPEAPSLTEMRGCALLPSAARLVPLPPSAACGLAACNSGRTYSRRGTSTRLAV